MGFDSEVQHLRGRKHMAADALSWFSTNQADDSDFHDNLLAHTVVDSHDELEKREKIEQTLLIVQRPAATQREDAHRLHLVEKDDAIDSPFFYNESDELSRRARPDKAIQTLVPLFQKKAVLKQEPDSTISGHPRSRRLYGRMRRSYC